MEEINIICLDPWPEKTIQLESEWSEGTTVQRSESRRDKENNPDLASSEPGLIKR